MKVLLLNNRYPSKAKPHVATYVQSIEGCLKAAGHEVDLLVGTNNYDGKWAKKIDLILYTLRVFFFSKYNQYDVIYLNHFTAFIHPLLKKQKKFKNIIIHWHGSDLLPQTKMASKMATKAKAFLNNNAITHIVPSTDFAKKLKEKYAIENAFISPSGGVDVHFFKGRKRDDFEGKVKLGFASGLQEQKGANLLPDLLKRADFIKEKTGNEIELHYIKYGLHYDEYSEKLQVFDNIVAHEVYHKSKINEFYNGIDILLLPTKRESLGLVALEAMACDKPVIGTYDHALTEYLISNQTGEGIKQDDYDDFERAIVKCINEYHNYAPRAFVIDRYSRESVTEFYKKLLSSFE